MDTELLKGVTVSGNVVNIAAAATPAAIFQISNFAQQIGTKSFKPKKLMVQSVASGGCWLSIGTGLGGLFVANMPAFRILNNLDNEWQEFDLPDREYLVDVTASVDALLAAGSLNIQVSGEECG